MCGVASLLSLLHTKRWSDATRLVSRRGRFSLSFRIVGFEMRCMQCLRSTEKNLFACVPLEYALSVWQMRNAFKSATAWWATMVVSGSEEVSCAVSKRNSFYFYAAAFCEILRNKGI